MNTINEIRTAIEARLATEMANAPAYTVAFQNVPFTPPNNTSWVQSSIHLVHMNLQHYKHQQVDITNIMVN